MIERHLFPWSILWWFVQLLRPPTAWRGHELRQRLSGHYVYCDTGQPVADWPDRPCGYCGAANTADGHDACIANLPDVAGACCGHGVERDAYVLFDDGRWIGGREALDWQGKAAADSTASEGDMIENESN